jgi:hypothetical protein
LTRSAKSILGFGFYLSRSIGCKIQPIFIPAVLNSFDVPDQNYQQDPSW